MRRLLRALFVLGLAAVAAGLWLTAPKRLPEGAYSGLTGNTVAGELVFWAAGCASCHSAPEAKDEAKLVLAGGQRFPSDFGTFLAPNISPDPEAGIGSWSFQDFANAVTRGVSPQGPTATIGALDGERSADEEPVAWPPGDEAALEDDEGA